MVRKRCAAGGSEHQARVPGTTAAVGGGTAARDLRRDVHHGHEGQLHAPEGARLVIAKEPRFVEELLVLSEENARLPALRGALAQDGHARAGWARSHAPAAWPRRSRCRRSPLGGRLGIAARPQPARDCARPPPRATRAAPSNALRRPPASTGVRARARVRRRKIDLVVLPLVPHGGPTSSAGPTSSSRARARATPSPATMTGLLLPSSGSAAASTPAGSGGPRRPAARTTLLAAGASAGSRRQPSWACRWAGVASAGTKR